MNSTLRHHSYSKPTEDIINLYKRGQLNLSPGFQRDSVWTLRERSKLIESVLRNYPLPAIFLYRREDKGKIIYDVIDGKQRLESLLMFVGLIRDKHYSVKTQLEDNTEIIEVDWNFLQRKKKQTLINGYQLYTIEVEGNLSDIIDLFVRINSTGKALTSSEKQHAKYYDSIFLKTAASIAHTYEKYFQTAGILSLSQVSRMKHVELVCEIMLSIGLNDAINKKAALDKIMGQGLSAQETVKLKAKCIKVFNTIHKMFPRLKETRFKGLSDFYVLSVLISRYDTEGLILTDKKRNSLAWDLLKQFSSGVDKVRQQQKKIESTSEVDSIYREYLLTVLQATDEISQRRKRMQIIDGVLRNLFNVKDKQRSFSPEQRRIIWHSTKEKKCQECNTVLTWDDFTIDHINPHSKGGKSEIKNATLMCRKHNSSKGNRISKKIKQVF